MSVLQVTPPPAGLVGVYPPVYYIATDDDLDTITTAGYLASNSQNMYGCVFANPSYCIVSNTTDDITPLVLTIANSGVITLTAPVSPGNVDLPVIANHIAVYTNTDGQIGDDAATAINGGNIQAGLSGTAGTLASFPATALKGSLALAAVANAGNTVTTISNVAMGQASVISIPDPAGSTANFALAPAALVTGNAVKASGTAGLLVDAGYNIKSAVTASYAGGGTSNAFTATGLTASSIVTAVIATSTNAVAIAKAVPSTNTLTVTFTADPGASTTVYWIATSAAVA